MNRWGSPSQYRPWPGRAFCGKTDIQGLDIIHGCERICDLRLALRARTLAAEDTAYGDMGHVAHACHSSSPEAHDDVKLTQQAIYMLSHSRGTDVTLEAFGRELTWMIGEEEDAGDSERST